MQVGGEDEAEDVVGDVFFAQHDVQQDAEADSGHQAAGHTETVGNPFRHELHISRGFFGTKIDKQEGNDGVEAEEDGHAEVVQLGNAAVVEGVGVVISFLHQRREGGEEEGDADLHEDGEGQGNTKGFICAFLGRDDEGGADDAAHDDVRWLRAGKRHKSHKHEFKGSAGDKPCLWVAHKDADDGTGDDRAVDVGQDVEEVDPRDAREDSNHERLDKGDVR